MNCPYCNPSTTMVPRKASDMMGLLLPKTHTVAKMMAGAADKARGKWLQCPNPDCRYVALFEKSPKE